MAIYDVQEALSASKQDSKIPPASEHSAKENLASARLGQFCPTWKL